ncbi:putative bifunctional lysylphosphatidylglycerol flippase/synthetase [Microvirga roseola]|uniref:lysylphosphatidylglycerol synthase domain-containing protein n=1 Tax=Microvirga roseola TaxID=2883126 RepID=UPI001E31E86C|nr:lysylphosphatidylglycerol synthase domain-containing protein [Microvirga roseola]
MRKIWRSMIAVAVIGLAGFLLYRTLSGYNFDQLVQAVMAVPVSNLLGAVGFAAASYLCLTGFDYLALHYVGNPLAYRKAALASFTALSLGHNIGFAALSSGAVRYRFYSRWGLGAGQVAKLIVFCGITVGLGLMVLGGTALLFRSGLAQEITGLTRPVILTLGSLCLALPALYLLMAAFVNRPLRIRRWTLEPPPLRLAIGQVVIGSFNFAFVAACLHQTLAAVADVPYGGVASVYVIANATALVSHVPGGLGVIESVVMYLLPQQDLIGPLLVFRFVYFLFPLVLGSLLLLTSELVYRGERPSSPGSGRRRREGVNYLRWSRRRNQNGSKGSCGSRRRVPKAGCVGPSSDMA